MIDAFLFEKYKMNRLKELNVYNCNMFQFIISYGLTHGSIDDRLKVGR